MRVILLFIGVVALPYAQPCPDHYYWLEGRCARGLRLQDQFIISRHLPRARRRCAEANAHLPIIKSEEENQLYARIANSFPEIKGKLIFLVLDLICNNKTRKLEWSDGTSVKYHPHDGTYNEDFDCVREKLTLFSNTLYKHWDIISINNYHSMKTVLCVIDPIVATTIMPTTTKGVPTTVVTPVIDLCGEYTSITNTTDEKKSCFKVFNDSMSWTNAQIQCSTDFGSLITINSVEENKFFHDTAISYNILSGMHIGAHLLNENATQWTWIDGEVPVDGQNYSNFVSFFPVPGAGECSSMATESTAQWINEDCEKNKQPFICRRSDFSGVPKSCPTDPIRVGEDFFPPGFPNSDTACQHYLIVAPKKLVELEIMTLVADNNTEFLEILEGTSGPHVIANLTGTIFNTTKFTTTESNVMRVYWKPSGSGSGRGFRIRFNEVDP